MLAILKKSHQSWKFYVLAAFATAYAGVDYWVKPDSPVSMGGPVLIFSVFAWACVSIRCPRCSAKWLWIAVSRPSTTYQGWNTRAACSECGWPAEDQRQDKPDGGARVETSLGSVAAFAGGLGVMFTLEPCLVMALAHPRHPDVVPLLVMLALGCLFAVAGVSSGKRALTEPPSGRRVRAVIGVWCSRAALLVGMSATLLLLTRIALSAR